MGYGFCELETIECIDICSKRELWKRVGNDGELCDE
jgi:hypothetical protein